MWTRTAVRVLTHRPVTRAWASTASSATATATAASPTSVQSTHDALYGQSGPSAAQENVTRPTEFPYEQPLASEQAPSSPVAAQTPTPPPPRADVHPEPAHSTLSAPRPPPRLLEPETPLPESPVSRSRRPVGAFRGGSVPPHRARQPVHTGFFFFGSPSADQPAAQDHRVPPRLDGRRRLRVFPRPG